jgi:hypothetical protein
MTSASTPQLLSGATALPLAAFTRAASLRQIASQDLDTLTGTSVTGTSVLTFVAAGAAAVPAAASESLAGSTTASEGGVDAAPAALDGRQQLMSASAALSTLPRAHHAATAAEQQLLLARQQSHSRASTSSERELAYWPELIQVGGGWGGGVCRCLLARLPTARSPACHQPPQAAALVGAPCLPDKCLLSRGRLLLLAGGGDPGAGPAHRCVPRAVPRQGRGHQSVQVSPRAPPGLASAGRCVQSCHPLLAARLLSSCLAQTPPVCHASGAEGACLPRAAVLQVPAGQRGGGGQGGRPGAAAGPAVPPVPAGPSGPGAARGAVPPHLRGGGGWNRRLATQRKHRQL